MPYMSPCSVIKRQDVSIISRSQEKLCAPPSFCRQRTMGRLADESRPDEVLLLVSDV
ncbi:uncharacterized protein RSE6_11046 [Rhynchosporium secalis]|uniref:Uncharacterized protein n=1 Tax=Rhynchosporium secalis TaxID=38038 RepID=A0A1E1MM02_RHYSE|nr:uncharacterized protein RSE6_11046 [Rhynchosporium secalis]